MIMLAPERGREKDLSIKTGEGRGERVITGRSRKVNTQLPRKGRKISSKRKKRGEKDLTHSSRCYFFCHVKEEGKLAREGDEKEESFVGRGQTKYFPPFPGEEREFLFTVLRERKGRGKEGLFFGKREIYPRWISPVFLFASEKGEKRVSPPAPERGGGDHTHKEGRKRGKRGNLLRRKEEAMNAISIGILPRRVHF